MSPDQDAWLLEPVPPIEADAGHALDAPAARADRVAWLRGVLGP